MKSHVFIILAHKQPKLLKRTISVLANENHYFYVNVDLKTTNFNEFEEEVEGMPNVTFFRKSIYHCGISHLYALLYILNNAYESDQHFDYFHIISGQDYPLRSNEQFDSFFESNNNESYMFFDDEAYRNRMSKELRIFAQQWHMNKTTGVLYKIYNFFHMPRLLSIIAPRKPIEGYSSGWDWFSWHRDVVEYVLEYFETNPNYIKRYNHTLCPTEHIFHTILEKKSDDLRIEKNNPLRYVSWTPHRDVDTEYRPFTLTEEDYNFVIESKAFFCRKVEEMDSIKLLDMIDKQRGQEYNITEHVNVM